MLMRAMETDWRERLLAAIDADERSDRAISLAAGLGPNFIGQMRGSKTAAPKNPGLNHVRKIVAALNVPLSSIVGGEEDKAPIGLRRVVVKAHVQAGDWAETWEWEDDDAYDVYVPDLPELRGFRLYAAETRGPSMNRRWAEKTVVVFTNVEETLEAPIAGKRYIVERQRPGGVAEHTVKLLHQDGEGKFWLMPESDDPRFQTPISIDDGISDETVAVIGRVHFSVARE